MITTAAFLFAGNVMAETIVGMILMRKIVRLALALRVNIAVTMSSVSLVGGCATTTTTVGTTLMNETVS